MYIARLLGLVRSGCSALLLILLLSAIFVDSHSVSSFSKAGG